MSIDPGDRRARRAAQRADARRVGSAAARPGETGRSTPGSRWLLPGLITGALVVAAALAIVLPGSAGPSGGGSPTVPPSGSAVGSTSAGASSTAASGAVATPKITGSALPGYEPQIADPAVGLAAPVVEGTDFDGQPVAIRAGGRAKVVIFLAHWCPHCQAEVPLVQAWVNSGAVPDGVELVSVATAIDPGAPNYPPDSWLEREGWTVPVLVDPDNAVASAYGLTAFPFWVFTGPDGNVRARATGEMAIADLEAMIRGLTTDP